MLCINPGEHGSTYGGNPLAAKVAITSLNVLIDEKLPENAFRLGKIFLSELKKIKNDHIKLVRGKGLFCAMVIIPKNGKNAWDVCLAFKEKGLLAKPTHGDIIRFAPPLIINESQLGECVSIINSVLINY